MARYEDTGQYLVYSQINSAEMFREYLSVVDRCVVVWLLTCWLTQTPHASDRQFLHSVRLTFLLLVRASLRIFLVIAGGIYSHLEICWPTPMLRTIAVFTGLINASLRLCCVSSHPALWDRLSCVQDSKRGIVELYQKSGIYDSDWLRINYLMRQYL